jgi:hypothetical protein
MLAVFEPDEFAQYPHLIRMLKGADSFPEAARRFFVYQHYYYGFPFYFFSAVSIFPLKLINGLESTTQTMWILRQFISVLPTIFSVLIFVYLFTHFECYLTSVGLYIFLLSVPAVLINSLWWHPDSLTILFIALTFLFLDRDDLKFGSNFHYAAITCGLTTGTKLIGLFFFLAIPTYIAWGFLTKSIDLKRVIISSAQFLLIMFAVIIISNPMLLIPDVRENIIRIQLKQSKAMIFGWQVEYNKGPQSWYGLINEYYGQWHFVVMAFVGVTIGIIRGPKRLLNTIVLTWVVPFSLYILFFISIKPKHFFLPIALPLFSGSINIYSLALDRGKNLQLAKKSSLFSFLFPLFSFIIVFSQFSSNLLWDIHFYSKELNREKNNPSITFFTNLEEEYLTEIAIEKKISVYRDIRVFVPDTLPWDSKYKWGIVNLAYIQELNPDLIMLSRQRARDYTTPGVVEAADDPAQMEKTFDFYMNALDHFIPGYHFLYEDNFGLAFLRDDLYRKYFAIDE